MHHPVLHNDATKAAADAPNNTSPSFPVLGIKHRITKLPRHREDSEDGPRDVSFQGM